MKKNQQGFTLIELMIVIAIIGILAAVALPAYQTYTEKARFAEVVLAASSVKSSVDICFQTRGEGDLTNCATDVQTGADLAGAAAGEEVASVTLVNSVVTATGNDADSSTYILSPVVSNGTLIWGTTGTCIANGVC